MTEGRSGRDFFGDARLDEATSAHGTTAGTLVDGILADVMDFQRDDPRDDIVVLAVRVP